MLFFQESLAAWKLLVVCVVAVEWGEGLTFSLLLAAAWSGEDRADPGWHSGWWVTLFCGWLRAAVFGMPPSAIVAGVLNIVAATQSLAPLQVPPPHLSREKLLHRIQELGAKRSFFHLERPIYNVRLT